mmetsp:Transcript_38179/g.92393  ORF Transcript_38179/g.92393 Transcript_38179/m.92393 type:complete len:544 (+) Transcript_38179:112-1743(+)
MNKGTTEEKKHNLSNLIRRQPWIGGPGSRLPFVVESFLGWGLAISCLSVACYHYVRQMVASYTLALPMAASVTQTNKGSNNSTTVVHNQTRKQRITNSPVLPLTTHSRKEILSKTTLERYQQLHQYMQKLDPVKSSQTDWPQDELVTLIRSNLILRRLVSLLMVKQQQDPLTTTTTMDYCWIQVLTDIWPKLVQLPYQEDDSSKYEHDISVIVPAYRESGPQLFRKLQEAHDLITTTTVEEDGSKKKSCKIEVIVVHAHCTDMETSFSLPEEEEEKHQHLHPQDQYKKMMPKFAKITCAPDVGGGRGPCLNHGAMLANGRVLTFLHADTRLAVGWNEALLEAFPPAASKLLLLNKDDDSSPPQTIANSCAFSFAIDTSTIKNNNNSKNDYFPPGIRAVEQTANWRSHWFHLPYGDQCLSVPSYVFEYVGGYPHQCLMEDYELVRLLRQRVAQVSSLSSSTSISRPIREELKILDLPAKCHVRRWQKFGVLYVTMTNSKLVNLYSRQDMTADELFAIYYGMDPEGKDDPIPWEVELEEFLSKQS